MINENVPWKIFRATKGQALEVQRRQEMDGRDAGLEMVGREMRAEVGGGGRLAELKAGGGF